MSKRALIVGCNYPESEYELHGCVNDAKNMRQLLLQYFGYKDEDIILMIDTDKRLPQPTGANIRKALKQIVVGTKPGDSVVFHYSGHGTQVPAESGKDDDNGTDECIVPCDINLMSDDDMRDVVNSIPMGVTFTFISDSCHSGGLIDNEKLQIGEEGRAASSSDGGKAFPGREFHLTGHKERQQRRGEDAEGQLSGNFRNLGVDEAAGYGRGGQGGTYGSGHGQQGEYGGVGTYGSQQQQQSGYDRGYRGGGEQQAGYGGGESGGYGQQTGYGGGESGGYGQQAGYGGGESGGYGQQAGYGGGESGGYGQQTGYGGGESGGYGLQTGYGGSESGGYGRQAGYGGGESGGYGRGGSHVQHSERGGRGYGPEGGRFNQGSELGGREESGGYERRGRLEEGYGHSSYGSEPTRGDYGGPGGYEGGNSYGRSRQSSKTREIPFSLLTSILSKKSGQEVGLGSVRPVLFSMFGNDSSPMVQNFMSVLLSQGPALLSAMEGGGGGGGGTFGILKGPVLAIVKQQLMGKIGLGGGSGSGAGGIMSDLLSGGHKQPEQKPSNGGGIGGLLSSFVGGGGAGADAGKSEAHSVESSGGGGGTAALLASLMGQGGGAEGSAPSGGLQAALMAGMSSLGGADMTRAAYAGMKPSRDKMVSEDMGILISGCEDSETSADADPDGNPDHAYGALSHCIQEVVKASSRPLSNRDLVMQVRAKVQQEGFSQHPCLYCSDSNSDQLFILGGRG